MDHLCPPNAPCSPLPHGLPSQRTMDPPGPEDVLRLRERLMEAQKGEKAWPALRALALLQSV